MNFDRPQTGQLVSLSSGDAELIVVPECGARIAAFRVGGRDFLRPMTQEGFATAFTYGFSAFPLLPYSGPVFGDGFKHRNIFYPLARNVPAEPSATHGEGWIRPWTIEERSAHSINLSLDYVPRSNAFPFTWHGEITYNLQGNSFLTEMKLVNRDYRPMPAGIGFHPYFPKSPGTVLKFDCTGLWPPDGPEMVGRGAGPIVAGLDFRAGQDVSPIILDRCYEGWNGVATLAAPDGTMTIIEADRIFGKLQVYDAWDYPYICVEPITNANDGFNRAELGVSGHGVVELQPGGCICGRIVISVLPAGHKLSHRDPRILNDNSYSWSQSAFTRHREGERDDTSVFRQYLNPKSGTVPLSS